MYLPGLSASDPAGRAGHTHLPTVFRDGAARYADAVGRQKLTERTVAERMRPVLGIDERAQFIFNCLGADRPAVLRTFDKEITQRIDAVRAWLRDLRTAYYNIPGTVPSPRDYPAGCRFSPRCAHSADRCRTERPPLYEMPDGRRARCFLCEEGGKRLD